MTISEDRIERAARKIVGMLGQNPDELWMAVGSEMVAAWTFYTSTVRVALEADAPELAAAEARGRVEGLREARMIAGSGHFLMKAPETIADGVLFHVRQTQAAIDARISALSKAPTADTEIGK